jgi:hypothetical protein
MPTSKGLTSKGLTSKVSNAKGPNAKGSTVDFPIAEVVGVLKCRHDKMSTVKTECRPSRSD